MCIFNEIEVLNTVVRTKSYKYSQNCFKKKNVLEIYVNLLLDGSKCWEWIKNRQKKVVQKKKKTNNQLEQQTR